MEFDRIAQLVRQADAQTSAPVVRGDVARRARRRVFRRRVARGCAVAAVVLVGAAVSFRVLHPPQRAPVVAVRPDVAKLRRECARLENEANLHERVAALLISSERDRRRLGERASDPVPAQVERSALILLRRGERLMGDPETRDQAVGVYRQTVRLFPQTRGGEAARKKLDQLSSNSAAWRKEHT